MAYFVLAAAIYEVMWILQVLLTAVVDAEVPFNSRNDLKVT
jgi:hypothetical protein